MVNYVLDIIYSTVKLRMVEVPICHETAEIGKIPLGVLVTRNLKDYDGTGVSVLNPWDLT